MSCSAELEGPFEMSAVLEFTDTPRYSARHFTMAEAAAFLRVSPRTLKRLTEAGQGLPFVRLGPRRIIFCRDDLIDWVQVRKCGDASKNKEARDA